MKAMEKEFGNISITETEDGFRVDIKGKDMKAAFSKCCATVMANCCPCPPEEETKET